MRRTIKGIKCTEYYYPVDGEIALPLELKKELGTIRVKCGEQLVGLFVAADGKEYVIIEHTDGFEDIYKVSK